MRRVTLPLLLALTLCSCAGKNPVTIERPNARTQLEETTYNILLVSENLITSAEECEAAPDCTISSFMLPIINRLIGGHNLARAAALDYADFLDGGGTSNAGLEARLGVLIGNLEGIITRVVSGGGQ